MTTEASLSTRGIFLAPFEKCLVVQYEISKYTALETMVLALVQDQ